MIYKLNVQYGTTEIPKPYVHKSQTLQTILFIHDDMLVYTEDVQYQSGILLIVRQLHKGKNGKGIV